MEQLPAVLERPIRPHIVHLTAQHAMPARMPTGRQCKVIRKRLRRKGGPHKLAVHRRRAVDERAQVRRDVQAQVLRFEGVEADDEEALLLRLRRGLPMGSGRSHLLNWRRRGVDVRVAEQRGADRDDKDAIMHGGTAVNRSR